MDIQTFERLQPRTTKSGKTRGDIARSAIRKGKAGERFVVDFLTETTGLSWIRIPNSGARTGMTNRDRAFQYTEEQLESMLGDIYAPHGLQLRYIIESKNYASFPFKKIEKGDIPAKLARWIYEINFDTETYVIFKERSEKQLREPISFLFIKVTKQGNWIVYNKDYFNKLFSGGIFMKPLYQVNYNPTEKLQKLGFGDIWFMEDFKEFIKKNSIILFERNNI